MKKRILLDILLAALAGAVLFLGARPLHLELLVTDPLERAALIGSVCGTCVVWGVCASAVLLKHAAMLDRVVAGWLVALLAITTLVVAGQFAGAALFAELVKLRDSVIGLWTLRDYWHALGAEKAVKRFLFIASVVAAAIPVLPIVAVAAALIAKPKRELHGDARFARAHEIRRYGLMDEATDQRLTATVQALREETTQWKEVVGRARQSFVGELVVKAADQGRLAATAEVADELARLRLALERRDPIKIRWPGTAPLSPRFASIPTAIAFWAGAGALWSVLHLSHLLGL